MCVLFWGNSLKAVTLFCLKNKHIDKFVVVIIVYMNWYNINNSINNALSISIDEEIGAFGVNAKDFIEEVKSSKSKEINLTINSGGGSIFEAFAIYDFLKTSNIKVNVEIVGIAASAASVLAYSGDGLPTMTENSVIMIHNSWMPIISMEGMNSDEIRKYQEELGKQADLMDSINLKIAKIYTNATGLGLEEVQDMMSNETWIFSEEASEKGFVSSVKEGMKVAAFASTDKLKELGYKNIPKDYVNQLNKSNMSEKKDSILDQIKALLGGEAKAEAPVEVKKEEAIDIEALKAEIKASIEAEASVELKEANAKLVELEEANAKKDAEVKASAESLEATKKELEKVSASREVIPAKEDVLESKKELIKDELGEAILATFEMSGLRNKK